MSYQEYIPQGNNSNKRWPIVLLLVIYIAMILGMMMTSCSSVKPIVAPPVTTSNTHVVTHDTVMMTDSVYIYENTIIREADSTALAELGLEMEDLRRSWIIQTTSLQREIHSLQMANSDTTYITDTIWQPYEVEKIVETEASLNAWQQIRLAIGNMAIIFFLIWLVVKFKKI